MNEDAGGHVRPAHQNREYMASEYVGNPTSEFRLDQALHGYTIHIGLCNANCELLENSVLKG